MTAAHGIDGVGFSQFEVCKPVSANFMSGDMQRRAYAVLQALSGCVALCRIIPTLSNRDCRSDT